MKVPFPPPIQKAGRWGKTTQRGTTHLTERKNPMPKPLSELSLEELWDLFPILLKEYNPAYPLWYEEERCSLLGCVGGENVERISHIGSTAVPGLLAKPTVDILLELSPGCDWVRQKHALEGAGWTLMSEEYGPEPRLSFNKGYTPEGFAERVFHLHVRRPGDWDELYFRDYLKTHPEAAEEYAALKQSLWNAYEHDRDGYTHAKTEIVKRFTQLARAELGSRYLPKS